MESNLDDTDRALLGLLQADARMPQSALGARVGLSAAAVNRRIRRIADTGVIQRVSAVVAPDRLDFRLTVIAQIEVVNEQPDALDQTQTAFTDCPHVQQCYYVTGEWDFVLVMLVADMDEYRRLTRELFFSTNNVKRFKTLVAMERCKATLDVPIAEGR